MSRRKLKDGRRGHAPVANLPKSAMAGMSADLPNGKMVEAGATALYACTCGECLTRHAEGTPVNERGQIDCSCPFAIIGSVRRLPPARGAVKLEALILIGIAVIAFLLWEIKKAVDQPESVKRFKDWQTRHPNRRGSGG
jgi:hypothetical protein